MKLPQNKLTQLILCSTLVAVFFVVINIISLNGGLLHPEIDYRIKYSLDDRPLLQKVFDVKHNDYGYYQAREISYFFDIVDHNFIVFSASIGLPHFYSVTAYIGIICLIFLVNFVSYYYLGQKSILILLLIDLVFLSSPQVFLDTFFPRTAKIIVTLFLTLTILFIAKLIRQKQKKTSTTILIAITSFFMSISDRQGFLYLTGLTIMSFILPFYKNNFNKYRKVSLYLLISLLCSILYAYIVAPFLIKLLEGYQPNFTYMNVPLMELFKYPNLMIDSGFYLLDILGFLLGNSRVLAVLAILTMFYAFYNHKKFKGNISTINPVSLMRGKEPLITLICIFLFSLVMYDVMIFRHPPILWEDLRREVYILPSTLLVLFGMSFSIIRLLIISPKLKKIIVCFLTVIAVFNIASLPYHLDILRKGHMNYRFINTSKAISCIKQFSISEKKFNLDSDMEGVCRFVREKAREL